MTPPSRAGQRRKRTGQGLPPPDLVVPYQQRRSRQLDHRTESQRKRCRVPVWPSRKQRCCEPCRDVQSFVHSRSQSVVVTSTAWDPLGQSACHQGTRNRATFSSILAPFHPERLFSRACTGRANDQKRF